VVELKKLEKKECRTPNVECRSGEISGFDGVGKGRRKRECRMSNAEYRMSKWEISGFDGVGKGMADF